MPVFVRGLVLSSMLFGCELGAPELAPEAAPEPVVEPAPEPAPTKRVFFKTPADGATVTSPVKVAFGIEGMTVQAAGEIVDGTGHHHLIIGPAGVAEGTVIPADETHLHFGMGQTEAEVELPPGDHKLTMQFADGAHASFGDVMAATISITVEE